ncbi:MULTISPECIES: DUF2909 domain-containing protein [unclassified Pseudoalteromonas]|uniref:DUF2909 domain-containing protein n=1 Tax=unclassified Pseudoalteromonas TaxID=194690 RepID=UPI0030150059
MIKIIIILLLLATFINLFRALLVMLRSEQRSMASLLMKRVYTSVAVIVLVLIAAQFGLLKLNPSPLATTHTQTQISTTTPHQQSANTKHPPETQNGSSR